MILTYITAGKSLVRKETNAKSISQNENSPLEVVGTRRHEHLTNQTINQRSSM